MIAKKSKPVLVTILQVNRQVTLVEWVSDGAAHRGYVPSSLVVDGSVETTELASAAPYGVPWAALFQVDAKSLPEKLEKALHNANLWTYRDVCNNPQAVIGAIQVAYGIDFSAVMAAARKYETGG